MNKIKVLYDVVNTMKKRDAVKGTIDFKVVKGEETIISFANEFSKDNASGNIKAKINKEINIDGKKIKQETDVDFNMKDCPFHKFHHGMHGHGHVHGNMHMSFKAKLSRAAFMLNVLNNLKAEEKDNMTILSLDLKEIMKEGQALRAEFENDFKGEQMERNQDEYSKENMRMHHQPPKFIKELFCDDYKDAVLNITVNKNNEVEKVELSANGDTAINGTLVINN